MKKQVGTLLAVTLAVAPAAAGPTHAHVARGPRAKPQAGAQVDPPHPPGEPDPWARATPAEAEPADVPRAARRVRAPQIVDQMFAMFGVATPRVLRSGAPACGNVQAKSPAPCTEDD